MGSLPVGLRVGAGQCVGRDYSEYSNKPTKANWAGPWPTYDEICWGPHFVMKSNKDKVLDGTGRD